MVDVGDRIKDNFKKELFTRKISFLRAQHPEAKFNANKFHYKPINKPLNQNKNDVKDTDSNIQEDNNNIVDNTPLKENKLHLGWLKKTRNGAGFKNYGQTCYLNSALQCLCYTAPLSNILLGLINFKKDCPLKSTNGFCVLCELQVLIRKSFRFDESEKNGSSGGSFSIYPKNIVSNLRSINRKFSFHKQEDSHEFLNLLLDRLEKSCIMHRSIFKQYKDFYQIPKTILQPGEEPPKYKPTSLVFAIFGGYLQSQVKCSSCNYESNTYDPYTDLSLCINKVSSIEKSLSKFCEKEILDHDNQYKCSKCKKKVRAQKQLTIYQAPNVLMLQLKRFDPFGRKIVKPVKYNEVLNLDPYITKESPSSTKKNIYNLYGVVLHYGNSIRSGHYTTIVKSSNGTWLSIDDEEVITISKSKVLDAMSEAYLLFYCRKEDNVSNSRSTNATEKPVQKEKAKEVLNMSKNYNDLLKNINEKNINEKPPANNGKEEAESKKTTIPQQDKMDVEKMTIERKKSSKNVVRELTKHEKNDEIKSKLMYGGHNVKSWDEEPLPDEDKNKLNEIQSKQLEHLEQYQNSIKKRKRDELDIEYDRGKLKKVKKKDKSEKNGENVNYFQLLHEEIVKGNGEKMIKKAKRARKLKQKKKMFKLRKKNK